MKQQVNIAFYGHCYAPTFSFVNMIIKYKNFPADNKSVRITEKTASL